jgi:hypothetical protein
MDSNSGGTGSYFWWARLVVAVLAIPSLGAIVAASMPVRGIGQIIIFVIACWICTYLGMKLMQSAERLSVFVIASTAKQPNYAT